MERAKNTNKKKSTAASLNEAAWDTNLINNSKNNKIGGKGDYGTESASNSSSGLSRLAMFKKLSEAASLKDGAAIPAKFASSQFARGKLMTVEGVPSTQQQTTQPNCNGEEETQNDNSKDKLIVEMPSSTSLGDPLTMPTLPSTEPNPRRRPFEATLENSESNKTEMSRGMSALIGALTTSYRDSSEKSDSKTADQKGVGDMDASPPRKARRRIVEAESSEEKEEKNPEDSSKKFDAYEMPDFDDAKNEGSKAARTGEGSNFGKHRSKRSKVDKPNYQRINMRKKCFTRFGAAATNNKRRLLKFRKRANRASCRREVAEAAEWGLDADAQDDGVQPQQQSNQQGTEPSHETAQQPNTSNNVFAPLSIAVCPSIIENSTFKERLFSDLTLSQEQQIAVEKLSSGNTVLHQLTPPSNYNGYEGWFHLSSAWSKIVAGVVELRRHENMFESSDCNSTAIGVVVLCDPTCPLPLPSLAKANNRKQNSKNSVVPSYNKGGVAITGEMTADDRQEVVKRARCAEISYVICRPEMLLSSDWFKRSGLPPVACICLLFAERILPAPWLADSSNITTFGKNNFSNVRPEAACLIARLYSIFEQTTESAFPLLVTTTVNVDFVGCALFAKPPSFKLCNNSSNNSDKDKKISVFSVNNKFAACAKLLLCLAEKGNLYSTVVFVCESQSVAMRLEQLLRQDGNVAVHFSFGQLGVGPSSSSSSQRGPIAIEMARIASQDDLVQTALQHSKSAKSSGIAGSASSSSLNTIITSVEALPHVFLYKGRSDNFGEKTFSVFVGLPPSSEHFSIVNRFTDDRCCVLVDSSPSVEMNISLRSVFALSGNVYLLKQITENILSPPNQPKSSTRDPSAPFWKAVDVASLAQKLDCHPSLVVAVIVQLFRRHIVVDVAGSRQDCCSVRLYGSDSNSVSLFEDNPLLVAARRVEGLDPGDMGANRANSSNQRSLTFSMCELANEMNQHPDQIRRLLYQLRPNTDLVNQGGKKTYFQRSPLVITFSPQWSLIFKIDRSTLTTDYDNLVMSVIDSITQNEKIVRANKASMASSICQVAAPLGVAKKDEIGTKFSEITFERFIDADVLNEEPELLEQKTCNAHELESAKNAIEDLIDSWSSTTEFTGRRVTPYAIARDLHGIVLPGVVNAGRKRAEWLPTMRVVSSDFQQSPHLRVQFLQLVDLARQALIS